VSAAVTVAAAALSARSVRPAARTSAGRKPRRRNHALRVSAAASAWRVGGRLAGACDGGGGGGGGGRAGGGVSDTACRHGACQQRRVIVPRQRQEQRRRRWRWRWRWRVRDRPSPLVEAAAAEVSAVAGRGLPATRRSAPDPLLNLKFRVKLSMCGAVT
jgi:hypothetical protein